MLSDQKSKYSDSVDALIKYVFDVYSLSTSLFFYYYVRKKQKSIESTSTYRKYILPKIHPESTSRKYNLTGLSSADRRTFLEPDVTPPVLVLLTE